MEGKNLVYIFQMLVKSDLFNCQHSLMDLMSMSYMEKSALWSYYGKFEMPILNSQLLLLHNCGDKKQYMYNGTSTCQAAINLAFVQLGEYKIVNVISNHAKNRIPNEPSNKEMGFIFLLHDRLIDAELLAIQISSLDPLESKFCLAKVSLAKGDYPNE
ncbi:hypothetical protein HCN44_000319 [Aphidius gifuensis]|uniref:Uncharacterized protein n=1 Tax=Aphidius gifuensis TaxID=684658 RepID=A0A835CPD7_APHGI|nr:hypothetical protein HCN44_000319 [Aphidius gifuensis]